MALSLRISGRCRWTRRPSSMIHVPVLLRNKTWLVIRIRHFNPLHVIKNTDYSVTSSLAGVHYLLHFYLFLVEFAMSIVEIL